MFVVMENVDCTDFENVCLVSSRWNSLQTVDRSTVDSRQ